jgi:deoxyribonuclease-1-like protein
MPLLRMGTRFVASQVSPVRFFGPSVSFIGMLVVGYMLFTGKIDLSSFDLGALASQLGSKDDPTTAITPVKLDQSAPRPADRIRIATFNIQVFGEKKTSDTNVMQTLATIVANFDLVAVQEVMSPKSMPVARLVDLINRSGGRYEATLSEPIGRTNHKEQYAFIWDATRMRMIPGSSYVVRDDADRMHREPMVASFETRAPAAQGRAPFRFTVINAHTDPDEVSSRDIASEMNVLDDVFVRVREYEYASNGEDDLLLVGDLNVDTANLGELAQIPGVVSIAGNQPTNTAGTKTYDHILIDRNITTEYTGRFGVIDYVRDFGLTPEQAALVSDHRPVWAEFSVYEIPAFANVAQQSQPVR